MAVYWYLVIVYVLVLCSKSALGIPLSNILKENATTQGLLEMYIPTMRAKYSVCRNDSLFYFEELRNHKLWASEMFDSSTKFPTGVLYGSTYDFGNFDECLDIKVPIQNRKLYGKYCMAKFTIHPPVDKDIIDKNTEYNYEFEAYTVYYNASVWKKIRDYMGDESKSPRNELHFAFCMPSSCSNEDLQQSLEEILAETFNNTDYQLSVKIDDRTCQIQEDLNLGNGDKAFIAIVVVAVLLVLLGSTYDILTKRDQFSKYKLYDKGHQAILCFSFPKNFKSFSSTNSNLDGLNCIAGMKVYSMFLIILLHRNMFDFGSAISNPNVIEKYYSKFELMFLLNGPILVDTFFTISGFLATYLTIYYYYKKKSSINVLMLYFHRYVRMAPTYAVILAFYCTILVKMGSGPLWKEIVGFEQEKCRSAWWANLLFINNYVETENYCMFQSWYMACDMNAFIFVPIICLILSKRPSLGVTTIIVLILASTITVFVTVYVYDALPILLLYFKILLKPNNDSTFLNIYIPGHMRATPYFVGVLAGYLKYQMNVNNYKIPKHCVTIGWTLSVPIMFCAIHLGFAFYVTRVSPLYSALYASLHHLGWGVAISWMLIAISSGHGPWVNSILSWSPLVVLSRLTYTVYLCHGSMQLISAGIMRHANYANNFNTLHSTAADIILAYILAFILTMLFESPMIGLEKVIFWRDQRRGSSNKKDEAETATELPTVN